MQSPTFIARMGQRFSTELTLAAILVLLLLVLSWISPVFWSDQNLANIVKQSAINGILAVGMTIIIISGGIDLSVGAVACLSGMVAAMLMTQGWSVGVSCAVALVAAVLVGVINGILIYEGDIPPFIATLGTLTMARGLVKLLTDARSVSGLPEGFLEFGQAAWLGMPSQFVVWMVLSALMAWLLSATRLGRNVFAIGSSVEVARLSGIKLRQTIYAVYGLGALMAGIAGIVLTARVRVATPTAANGYELYAIAAAVIGGASLAGAQGSIVGAILGALIMTTIANGGNLLGVDAFTLEIVIGALIVFAVWLDKLRKTRKR